MGYIALARQQVNPLVSVPFFLAHIIVGHSAFHPSIAPALRVWDQSFYSLAPVSSNADLRVDNIKGMKEQLNVRKIETGSLT